MRKRSFNYFIPLAVVLALATGVITALKPWVVYKEQKAEADGLKSELNHLEATRTERQQREQKRSPAQMEEEARRLGYTKPGEKPLK